MPHIEFEPPETGEGKLFAGVIIGMVVFGFILAFLAECGLRQPVQP